MMPTLRYELRMQLRRRAQWTVLVVTLGLLMLTVHQELPVILREPPRTAMVRVTLFCDLLLPVGCAFLLADRLVRDDQLGVAAVLDATPAGRLGRLLGKYAGCLTAAGLPVAAVYFGFATWYALRDSAPGALLWAAAMFGTVMLPALLLVGALALTGPLLVPAPVFRILFLGYWIWTSYLVPPRLVPTLSQSIVSPTGGYPIQVFFAYHGGHAASTKWAGPEPGALFNTLRPHPSAATAWLSIVDLVLLSALILSTGHLLRQRRTR